jgi:hypothetical protein
MIQLSFTSFGSSVLSKSTVKRPDDDTAPSGPVNSRPSSKMIDVGSTSKTTELVTSRTSPPRSTTPELRRVVY